MLPKLKSAELISCLMFLAHLCYTLLLFPLICFKMLGLNTEQLFYLSCIMGVAAVISWFFLFRKVLNVVYAARIFKSM